MTASDLKRTSAMVSVITKTSSIDHRPMPSTMRKSVVRWRGCQVERICTLMTRKPSVTSLSIGTRMLAMKITAASG